MSVYRVEVDNLSVSYGRHQVLKNVSLKFKKKTVSALLGASGCGKSTFLRSINRMNDYVEGCIVLGSVKIDGYNIYDRSVDPVLLRAKVGMVFQRPNPFPWSIYDNVAYGPRIHNRLLNRKKKLDDVVIKSLKRVGLLEEVEHRLDDNAENLSGGQQQRLCIARAIAVDPEVILMDEPCSALDIKATLSIERLVVELKRKYTIIIITHSVKQAMRVADYVAFFHNGFLVECNEAEGFFSCPKDERLVSYLDMHKQVE